jgi:pimeloyl-ACP methyl ester carboxylesterase
VPVLGIHGSDDPISPLGQARDQDAAPSFELVSITAARHDVLNDQTHRTVAAIVVLFLERIRQDAGPRPIAVPEQLGR